ncbi:MAG: hypothetical protein ABIO36_03765, partial [Pyrinomonadaceae bacterium]
SWCAWEPLAVEARSSNNTNIYVFEDLAAYHIWFGERNNDSRAQIFKVTDVEGIAEDKAYFLPRGFDGVGRVSFSDISEPRLWIAYRSKIINSSEPPLRNFLVKGYHIADQRVMSAGSEKAIFLLLEK